MSMVTHDKIEKLPTRKHIAERQRRARINHLLEQLEILITPKDKTGGSPVKLEKAEVLERTVEYIKRLKCQSTDPASTYIYGYMKCIESINHCLKEASIPQTLLHSIQSYLLAAIPKETPPSTVHVPLESNNNEQLFTFCSLSHNKDFTETEGEIEHTIVSADCKDDRDICFRNVEPEVDQSREMKLQTLHGNTVWRPW